MNIINNPFKIPYEIVKECKKYAEDRYTTSSYHYKEDRDQSDPIKVKRDDKIGKIAEALMYNKLRNYSLITKVDYKIYEVPLKSWKSDLYFLNPDYTPSIGIAVKSCYSNSPYGLSWMFQCNEQNKSKGYDYEIFDDPKRELFVSFVEINDIENFGIIKCIVSLDFLHTNKLFKDPKLSQHIGKKKAIYYDDLIELGNLWQI